MAPEIVELMVYCKAVSFGRAAFKNTVSFGSECGEEQTANADEMCSFSETKAKEIMVDANRPAFQWRHKRQISRIYPKAILELKKYLKTICQEVHSGLYYLQCLLQAQLHTFQLEKSLFSA